MGPICLLSQGRFGGLKSQSALAAAYGKVKDQLKMA